MMMKQLLIILILFTATGCATTNLDRGNELYAQGRYDEAAAQWNSLAQLGNPYAQHNVGLLWQYGLGSTPLNEAEASQWFLLSANQGLVLSMVKLADIQFRHGHEASAISWLNLAARWGDADAVSMLNERDLPIPKPDLYYQQLNAQRQQPNESESSGWMNLLLLGVQLHNASQGIQPIGLGYQPGDLTTTPDVCNCIGYDGAGGACYTGPGGPAYNGPGGPAYAGPGGPCYSGPGGAMYDGPGGPAYDGPGGPKYDGPGGPAYDGSGGPAYSGPGGPCYNGPGGPCFEGPGSNNKTCPAVCGGLKK